MAIDPDIAHRREYETIRREHTQLPEWDALTDLQKANIREANKEKWGFFRDLGDAIRKGTA